MLAGHRFGRDTSLPRHAAIERAANSFGGAIDGDIQIGLGILDHQGGGALEAEFDGAALVHTAARAIDVGEAHDDASHDIPAVIERVGESRRDMLPKSLGQGEILGLELNVHWIPLVFVVDGKSIMGLEDVRFKQINGIVKIEKSE